MSRRPTVLALCLATLPLFAACSDDDGSGEKPLPRLLPLASCGEAQSYIKQVAIRKMNQQINDNIAAYIRGEGCYRGGYGEDDGGSPTAGGGAGSGSGGGGPTTGTGTNNQVAGVDEADFVKNDGQYIYLAQNGALRIVDSWPAPETHLVSKTPLPGEPKKLFVVGDTALVYVAIGTDSGGGYWNRECTYGYDCDFSGDGTATTMLVYDISNRAAPHLVRQIALSGSLIAARRIGSTVHTVVSQAAQLFPELQYQPAVEANDDLCSYVGVRPPQAKINRARQKYEAVRAANLELIENTNLDAALPSFTDDSGLTPTGESASCTSLYASSYADGAAFTSLVSVDVEHPGPVHSSTIISRGGAIYASADALYMAVPHNWYQDDLSTIHKFQISESAGDTHYLASGEVNGRALNQFAMDEQNGKLRIATTDGHAPSPDAVSYVTVLGQQGEDLVTLGSIGGIAPSEDIRSVRFDGNHAFVVTFKKTDPLFAFDLSNPYAPRKLGELKIPGFSTYMHLLDDNHLLTIGYDADDHGDFAFFDGVMLQIFDVTNPMVPRLAHKHIIGTRGSSSEALTNHLAFTWYPERSLLSIPMTICEGGDDGQYGQTMSFSGLMVFDASVASGFAEHGRVAHAVDPSVNCYNWWSNATSAVKRSLFLDQYVYSISDAELKVRDVGALSTEVVTVPLAN
ncbi:MAG: hypothetical protein HOV81_21035 [Kofleriaceae bacterium]|nr:hypothetical protein [Kofleriaceae bacterium]